MALKIRKTIKLAPGVKLNVSKKGVSTTIGKKGASVNVGKRGTYVNAGIPGTGISSRTKVSGSSKGRKQPEPVEKQAGAKDFIVGFLVLCFIIFIFIQIIG